MGPLEGIRVVEFAGIGPGPLAAMLLADLGAEVLRVDRPEVAESAERGGARPHLSAGRPLLGLDLKEAEGLNRARRLADAADVLLEGFRPGTMERLGLGPEECLKSNPRLVYARMTGWGQDGPLAGQAGHDMNYIAVNGVLHGLGRHDTGPVPPANLVGDFGGGSLFAVTGILSALVERNSSGLGQVVDAAMVDGSAFLASMIHEDRAHGTWSDERGTNYLDTGAPFYDVYECSGGGYVAVAALEPRFYAALLEGLGLTEADLPGQWERARWPELRARFAAVLGARPRDEWTAVFAGTDACVQPVLSLAEAPGHPHIAARGTLARDGDRVYAGPAPRFGRTPGTVSRSPGAAEVSAAERLREWEADG